MQTCTNISDLRPRVIEHRRTLPIIGSLVDGFAGWLSRHGYSDATVGNQVDAFPVLAAWFQRHGKLDLQAIGERDFSILRSEYRDDSRHVGQCARSLCLFLVGEGLLKKESRRLSRSEREVEAFIGFLREDRGLAEDSMRHYRRHVLDFLAFIKFDQRPSAIRHLTRRDVEAFIRGISSKYSRHALTNVITEIRAFLRRAYSRSILLEPLHEQIDTPRVYAMEQLPRALPWDQVTALLRSIDQSSPNGLRDFTMIYLAAFYGLRSMELVTLRLEDVNWHQGTLLVRQSKTKQTLVLPLTDEAGDILGHYLRQARPRSARREIFLPQNAPIRALTSTAVGAIIISRIQKSGLPLPRVRGHALRHSFAVRLLRGGVSVPDIGGTLGHRTATSTSAYLRLDVEELRVMGLPTPKLASPATIAPPGWHQAVPRVRGIVARPIRHKRWVSFLGASLREYVATKRALGRGFYCEERFLRAWDSFLGKEYPQAKLVSPEMFDRWAGSLERLNPTVRRTVLRTTRNFLTFHQRCDKRTYVPDVALFPKNIPYRRPRLVTNAEIATLVATAKALPNSYRNPIRGHSVGVALTLLFSCGLRRGELMRLQLADFDPRERLLRITKTKFYKSRLVPLSVSVTRTLIRYLQSRKRHGLPMDLDTHLLWWWYKNCPAVPNTLALIWRHLCVSTSVLDSHGHPPTLHDLRHSYAVEALHRCYTPGRDMPSKLQHLAIYLGHQSIEMTYHYLHLTPDLRQRASQRFHDRFFAVANRTAS